MSRFPLLVDPYLPCSVDLLADGDARAYWLDLFDGHFDVQLRAAQEGGLSAVQVAHARAAMSAEIAALRRTPDRFGRLDILLLCERRRAAMDAHGVVDEFAAIKARENDAALATLPAWLDRLDAEAPEAAVASIVRGMLAGNLFDMGARSTTERFAGAGLPFETALAEVPARPWHRDDLDRAAAALAGRRGGRAVVFADNAGADVVLGVLPLARFLVRRGTTVVIAANSAPSLNDVTASELRAVLRRAAAHEPLFGDGAIRVEASGCGLPLIDLADVSPALADAARGADLVVLVGMGRGIESNWTARFTAAALRVAMIKDAQVACTVGGRLFDAVCRYDEPAVRS